MAMRLHIGNQALRAALVEKSMNDEMKNKSGKVKVMYVRSDDDSDKRTQNPRTGKGGGRPASSCRRWPSPRPR